MVENLEDMSYKNSFERDSARRAGQMPLTTSAQRMSILITEMPQRRTVLFGREFGRCNVQTTDMSETWLEAE